MADRKAGGDFVGIVVAAGSAARYGGPVPKQFLDLGGASLIERSIDALAAHEAVRGVVVVLAPDEIATPRGLGLRSRAGVLRVVAGGETRSRSALRGLQAAGDAPFVLVHDAARPLASREVVEGVVEATRRHGAAVPALRVPDTVKRVVEDPGGSAWVAATLDRSELRLAQTPQGARADWLREALARAEREGLEPTDEAAALEREGRPVAVSPGDPANRKITTPADLDAARLALRPPASLDDLRVGSGFDIHRFGGERPLRLGGVEFAGEPGLDGHSDADVVLHAAMDALLGAAGLDDIGQLFPPGDPAWSGADSRDLAARVAGRVREAGFAIVNVDVTLLAERPRIRPRVGAMREAIARALGVDPDRIGVKATTLERLGALGRSEGIACEAVALLRRGGPG